jgi:hypothetical protein
MIGFLICMRGLYHFWSSRQLGSSPQSKSIVNERMLPQCGDAVEAKLVIMPALAWTPFPRSEQELRAISPEKSQVFAQG